MQDCGKVGGRQNSAGFFGWAGRCRLLCRGQRPHDFHRCADRYDLDKAGFDRPADQQTDSLWPGGTDTFRRKKAEVPQIDMHVRLWHHVDRIAKVEAAAGIRLAFPQDPEPGPGKLVAQRGQDLQGGHARCRDPPGRLFQRALKDAA